MTANILLVVLFISAIVIAILVLLQNKGGDMGSAFGGGSNTLFGARGSADFLTRMTSITAMVFFLSALALAYIYANQGRQATDSVIQTTQTGESELPASQDTAQDSQTTEQAGDTQTTESSETAQTAEAEAEEVPAADAEQETDVPAVPE